VDGLPVAQPYDVAIIGAGPAGSTVARFVAKEGFRAIVFDRRNTVGVPVQCGELVPTSSEAHRLFPRSKRMPKAVQIPKRFITNKTHTIRLISPNGRSYEFPFQANIIDRARFDQYLVQLAENAGAEFRLGSTLKELSDMNILEIRSRQSTYTVNSKLVVGADGANSVVARSLGTQYVHAEPDLSPSLQFVMSGADVDDSVVEMHFGDRIAPGGYAWVIPKGNGLVNVGFGMRRCIAQDDTPLRRYLERFAFKILAPQLKNAKISHRVGAIIPVGGPLRKTWSSNLLLVGDAAGHIMASNGGGIPTALCGGQIAGDTISKHLRMDTPLSTYEDQWKLEFGKELDTALRVLRVADSVMPSDTMTDICMRLAGVRFLEPLIRCRLPLPVDIASKTMVKALNHFI
jgi:digeranylgeranylglycerophospholipid reductase